MGQHPARDATIDEIFEALEEACSQDSPRAQSAFENLMIH